MKKLIVFLLVLLMVAGFAAGCTKTPVAEESKAEEPAKEEAAEAPADEYDPLEHPIAFTMALKSHPVVQIMIAGFLNRAEELGYEPKLYAPDDWDLPKSYELMEAGLAQHKIEGMCIYIFDDSVDQYIKKLSDSGIYVVTGHTKVEEGTKPGLSAWAACDAVAYGKASAQAIGKAIGGKGTLKAHPSRRFPRRTWDPAPHHEDIRCFLNLGCLASRNSLTSDLFGNANRYASLNINKNPRDTAFSAQFLL